MCIFGNCNEQKSDLSLEVERLNDAILLLQDKVKYLTYELTVLKYKDIYDYLDKNPDMKHFIFNSNNKKQDIIYLLLKNTFNELYIVYTGINSYIDYCIGDSPVCLSKVIEDLEGIRTKLKEAKQND